MAKKAYITVTEHFDSIECRVYKPGQKRMLDEKDTQTAHCKPAAKVAAPVEDIEDDEPTAEVEAPKKAPKAAPKKAPGKSQVNIMD